VKSAQSDWEDIVMPFPLLAPVISTLIGAKIAAFLVSVVTAPTNKGSREAILLHVEHVLEGMDTAGIGIGPEDRLSINEDLMLLRNGVEMGWHEEYESLALLRLTKFLSVAHAKSTGFGASSFAASHSKAATDWVWKTGNSAFESIFRPRT
jgi:hypothetical protein